MFLHTHREKLEEEINEQSYNMNYCNLDLWRIHVFSEDDNAMQRQK